MKNSIKNNKNKLLKLKIIKNKLYDNNFNDYAKINSIVSHIKKVLFIIYKFHINNKQILFIGTSIMFKHNLKTLLKINNHKFIDTSLKQFNLSNHKTRKKNKLSLFSHNLKQKIDLVVILDESLDENIIKEAYLLNIPIITISANEKKFEMEPSYKIEGNFNFTKKKIKNNIFYSLLTTTLKKGNKLKSNNFQLNS